MADGLMIAGYIKKLEWAISLSQKNLQDLREGDWLNLREELYEFLRGPEAPADLRKEIFFKRATLSSIKAIQGELKTRFDQCVDMYTSWEKGGLKEAILGIAPFDVSGATVHLTAQSPDLSFHQTVSCEDLKTEVLLKLNNLLEVSGVIMSQIRRCPDADCGRLFLLRMKPRADRNFYCSRRCSGLAATREYRRKKEEELRAKDRGRYAKKQRQKYGATTRVGRTRA
jgi:hypothetical protein